MKKLILILIAALFMVGCKNNDRNEPDYGNVSFSYKRTGPLTYEFTNESSLTGTYKWDFGDGTYATTENATHTYASAGKSYIVTLTITHNKQKYDSRANITITKPIIYFAGYTLYSIPSENKYYKLSFKDGALLPSDWDFYTIYTPLLDNTDIPYSITWIHPQPLENPEKYSAYKIQLIYTNNTSGTSGDKTCFTISMAVSDIMKYKEELIYESSDKKSKVGIKIGYDY